jgi:UDP-GlcNAc:undecaprenyl-phosphate GlcNAc-1-phosphate transferase
MSTGMMIAAATASAVVTLLMCLYARPICAALRIMDIPDARKRHTHPTPLVGGVALLFAVVPLVLASTLASGATETLPATMIWAAAVTAMALVGLADDRHTLTARDRLLISFLVFGSVAIIDPLFNVRVLEFRFFTAEIGLATGWLAVAFTAICCVGLVNAVNMADGKNGLVIGMTLGWLLLLGMRAPAGLLPLVAITGAAWAILLVFNLRGRLFLGDGGAYGIATAVGLLSILIYNSRAETGQRPIHADELMVLFAVPVLDSFRLTFSRMRRGLSPMAADRNHLHHHLQDRLGWPRGLFVYWIMALLPCGLLLLNVNTLN